mmetsp:Transcript_44291/g.117465  ORF Transcript_44291/g.117465 Transcript_44291/m.117465 type:complete len:310 (-) Transcript_44291:624-1553(-)
MGQTESVGDGPVPTTPPDVEASRRRQDYLHRLGIQKDKRSSFFHAPTSPLEAPGQLQTLAEQHDPTEIANSTFQMNEFGIKSQDDHRLAYLRKLSYQKVWVPQAQRPPKHQTVIIFDWDDTLLCTTFLNFRQDQALSSVVERQLRSIEKAGRRLLELALGLGHTFIITNAMNGWVEYSAAKWVPEYLPVLQKVRVISARGKYEAQYPNEVSQWKIQAFLEVQKQLDSEIITNLISLGDSNFEMDAVHVMGKEFAQAFIKTIKFQEHPNPEELLKQLELVTQKFEKIVENARNLKIGLERKRVASAQHST